MKNDEPSTLDVGPASRIAEHTKETKAPLRNLRVTENVVSSNGKTERLAGFREQLGKSKPVLKIPGQNAGLAVEIEESLRVTTEIKFEMDEAISSSKVSGDEPLIKLIDKWTKRPLDPQYWRKVLIWAVDTAEFDFLKVFTQYSSDTLQSLLYTTEQDGYPLFIRAVKRKRLKIIELLISHSDRLFDRYCADVKGEDLGVEAILRAITFDFDRIQNTSLDQERRALKREQLKEFHDCVKSRVTWRSNNSSIPEYLQTTRLNLGFQKTFQDTREWLLIKQWASAVGLDSALSNLDFTMREEFEILDYMVLESGLNPIHLSVELLSKEEIEMRLEALLRNRAKDLKFEMLHKRSSRPDDQGWTALHIAASTGNIDMLRLLIQAYDDVSKYKKARNWDFFDKMWMTPLHYAALKQEVGIVEMLLASPFYADHVNEGDLSMRTPLHMACTGVPCDQTLPSVSLVKTFMDSPSVDVNPKDCCGFTPLHWAVYVGAADVVDFIVSRSRDRTSSIRIRTSDGDYDGRTVLNYATEHVDLGYPLEIDRTDHVFKMKEMERLLSQDPDVKAEEDRFYRDRQVYVDAANAILVGAALIASVTFGGWLQPPFGDDSFSRTEVQVFWVFNSLSFFFAIATIMSGAGAVLPVTDVYIRVAVERTREFLALTSFLLVISTMFVLGAFGAAGFASLLRAPEMRTNMSVTVSLGMVVCFLVGTLFFTRLRRIPIRWTQLMSLTQRLVQNVNRSREHKSLRILRSCKDCCIDYRSSFKRARQHLTWVKKLPIILREDAFWVKAEKHLDGILLQKFYESCKSIATIAHDHHDANSLFKRSIIDDALKLESLISEWPPIDIGAGMELLPQLKAIMLQELTQFISTLFALQYLGRGFFHFYFEIDVRTCRKSCVVRDQKTFAQLNNYEEDLPVPNREDYMTFFS